jgi:hypothetical protein
MTRAASQATGHISIETMMVLRANRGLEEDCPDQLVFRDLCASGMRAETLRQHARNRLGRIVGGRYLPPDRAMASIPAHPRTMFSLSALTGSEEYFTIVTRVFGLIQMCWPFTPTAKKEP